MGRKNKRKKSAYYRRMKGDPRKMIGKNYIRRDASVEPATAVHEATEPCATPKRGEIWFADFGSHPGTSIQEGCRPAVILSNDMANHYSATLTAIPLTTKMKKPGLPTHVVISPSDVALAEGQYMEKSMVLAEQVATIGKNGLTNCVGTVSENMLKEIEAALLVQIGLDAAASITSPASPAPAPALT